MTRQARLVRILFRENPPQHARKEQDGKCGPRQRGAPRYAQQADYQEEQGYSQQVEGKQALSAKNRKVYDRYERQGT